MATVGVAAVMRMIRMVTTAMRGMSVRSIQVGMLILTWTDVAAALLSYMVLVTELVVLSAPS